MKYLLVLIVVTVAIGIWRSRRREEQPPQRRAGASRSPSPAAPQDMVECAHCGLHLPRAEAVDGEGRSYCSTEHLAQARTHRP